ncbi:MAG: CoA transferase [Proteobacteria bacterium]|nr:CoA transferase [Pseudomonadota bacterium]
MLDFTRVFSGPICGRMLADLGADVIKVEAPEGDVVRSTPPWASGTSMMYAHMNAGKRNLSVDLKTPGAADLLARLAARCDVLLENFRPGVLARFGLGAEELRARHPRLIYCSVTGWGQSGPLARHPAYAPLVAAEAGLLDLDRRLRGGEAQGEVHQHGDIYAGVMACNAVLGALYQRESSGRGQHLDVSMAEARLYVSEHTGVDLAGFGGERGFDTWTFLTPSLGDGRRVHLLGNPRRLFHAWIEALGGDGLEGDPRFATPEAIGEHLDAALAELEARTRRFPDFAALERALEGRPLMFAEVRTTAEVCESEWAEQRRAIRELAPGVRVPDAPWRSSDAEIGAAGPALARGASNREVLSELLELSEAEIERLERDGVLRTGGLDPDGA